MATTPFDLSISPSVVELTMQPGKMVTQTFMVENAGTTDLTVTATLRDFTSDGKTGVPIIQEKSTFPFAQLENADVHLGEPFTLKANSSQQLIFAVKPDETAEERDWYISLLLDTKPVVGETLAQSGTAVTGQIASNIIVRVARDDRIPLNWDVQLLGIPRFIDSLQSIQITPYVQNHSKTAGTPEMSMLILDWRGEIVFEQDGLPERVLANSSREIAAALQRKDDPRSYQPTTFVFDPLFAVGPYTVRTTIRNNEDGPRVVEKSFVAFPFSVLIAVIFLATGLMALSRLRKRRTPVHKPPTSS